jgi:hypothetical protein
MGAGSMVDGRQSFARIKKVFAEKKLKPYQPEALKQAFCGNNVACLMILGDI